MSIGYDTAIKGIQSRLNSHQSIDVNSIALIWASKNNLVEQFRLRFLAE